MAGCHCKDSLSKAATDAVLIPFCFSTSLPNCVSLVVVLAWKRIVASCVCPDEYIFVRDALRQRIINLPVFAKLAAPLQEFILGKAWASSATTVARDALAAFDGPIVELHLSNPDAREPWRRTSVVAPVATGTVSGFGADGYELAVRAVVARLGQASE